ADNPKQTAAQHAEPGAPRLTGHEEAHKSCCPGEQAHQLLACKMVQKKIAGDDFHRVRTCSFNKIKHVCGTRFNMPSQGGESLACSAAHDILPIVQDNPYAAPMRRQPACNMQHELTVA